MNGSTAESVAEGECPKDTEELKDKVEVRCGFPVSQNGTILILSQGRRQEELEREKEPRETEEAAKMAKAVEGFDGELEVRCDPPLSQ